MSAPIPVLSDQSDRCRQNAFVLDDWMVLRFTPRRIDDHPDEVIDEVRRGIDLRSRR